MSRGGSSVRLFCRRVSRFDSVNRRIGLVEWAVGSRASRLGACVYVFGSTERADHSRETCGASRTRPTRTTARGIHSGRSAINRELDGARNTAHPARPAPLSWPRTCRGEHCVSNKMPAGIYDLLLTDREADRIEEGTSQIRPLRQAESARLAEVLQRQLVGALSDMADGDTIKPQLALINRLLVELRQNLPPDLAEGLEFVADPPRVLTSIRRHGVHPEPPETGLMAPWLFTAGKGTPSLLSELRRELASAEQVDMLVSFITVSGVRKLRDVLQTATATGADGNPPMKIRVLTTTYIGATEVAAVDELARLPGCEVRISLDGRRTRLHAKAWIFHRNTGFGSAYVGSANMTGAALAGGWSGP